MSDPFQSPLSSPRPPNPGSSGKPPSDPHTHELWCMVGFVDLVSSTRLWNTFGPRMNEAIVHHENNIQQVVEKHGGIIVKTIGDASMFVIEYTRMPSLERITQDAFRVGTDIQRITRTDTRLRFAAKHTHKSPTRFQVRVGMAFGLAVRRTVRIQSCQLHDYFGSVVNLASRMESKVCPVSPKGAFTLGFSLSFTKQFNRLEIHRRILEYWKKPGHKLEFAAYQKSNDAHLNYFTRSRRLLSIHHRDPLELKGAGDADTWTVHVQ